MKPVRAPAVGERWLGFRGMRSISRRGVAQGLSELGNAPYITAVQYRVLSIVHVAGLGIAFRQWS